MQTVISTADICKTSQLRPEQSKLINNDTAGGRNYMYFWFVKCPFNIHCGLVFEVWSHLLCSQLWPWSAGSLCPFLSRGWPTYIPGHPSGDPLFHSLFSLILPLSLQTASHSFVIVCFLSLTHLSLLFSLSFLVFPLSVPNNNIAHSNLLYRQ